MFSLNVIAIWFFDHEVVIKPRDLSSPKYPPVMFIHAENDMAELNIQSHFYKNLQNEEHGESFQSGAKLEPKSIGGAVPLPGHLLQSKNIGELHLGSKGRFSYIIMLAYFLS